MKKTLLAILINLAFLSCDFHPLYKENETVYFLMHNAGQSKYSRIIVYAKDSSRIYIDSTSPTGYSPNSSLNTASAPNSKDVSMGITLSNLKDVKNGVFEVQATILNGKVLSHEFGVIDGLKTRQKFKVDLKDSTIFIR
ncbi:hypothetical protein [Dyadobacter arcticus]|uniref:Late embryogenesis abundant protein LEA-2 subgroup domain-containing protein n=1 Tax=Dyadobacter arcticus TaxID=1078754 RepID=A0ABX0UKV5_9BACT|nr:hypothetical protein [Dyadobacter arcticus]NIJ52055.1 hypothetical protein [Dyadobacter arcticus]